MDRDQFDYHVGEAALKFFNNAEKRDDVEGRRHAELLRTHRDGWQLVARSLETGLRTIADAIRDHGRR